MRRQLRKGRGFTVRTSLCRISVVTLLVVAVYVAVQAHRIHVYNVNDMEPYLATWRFPYVPVAAAAVAAGLLSLVFVLLPTAAQECRRGYKLGFASVAVAAPAVATYVVVCMVQAHAIAPYNDPAAWLNSATVALVLQALLLLGLAVAGRRRAAARRSMTARSLISGFPVTGEHQDDV